MARTFLMTAPALAGHVMPMLGIARALVQRGHRVLFHTGGAFESAIASAGATCLPSIRYQDVLTREVDRTPPAWLPRLLHGMWRARLAVRESILELNEELAEHLRREPVDCVVADFSSLGTRYAAERAGCPFVSVSPNIIGALKEDGTFALQRMPLSGVLPQRAAFWMMDAVHPLRALRGQLGLPPRREPLPEYLHLSFSDTLNVVLAPRGLYPASGMRGAQAFPGPVSFDVPWGAPSFQGPLTPDTLVVSTTTARGADGGMLERALRGVEPLGHPVLAATAASDSIPQGLGAHVRLERFIPHDQVFPQVAALVTQGGWGTVGKALRHGLPMLIISRVNDQPFTGRRLEELGLAYHLPFAHATQEAIRERVATLLKDEALRQRVKALGEHLRATDPAQEAARLIEGVCRSAPARAPDVARASGT